MFMILLGYSGLLDLLQVCTLDLPKVWHSKPFPISYQLLHTYSTMLLLVVNIILIKKIVMLYLFKKILNFPRASLPLKRRRNPSIHLTFERKRLWIIIYFIIMYSWFTFTLCFITMMLCHETTMWMKHYMDRGVSNIQESKRSCTAV